MKWWKKINPQPPGQMQNIMIFRAFKRGVFYELLYEDYDIKQQDLIRILQKSIKGNYDYQQILSGGEKAQKQFLKHLSSRWNPLEPDAPWEEKSAYAAVKDMDTDKKI